MPGGNGKQQRQRLSRELIVAEAALEDAFVRTISDHHTAFLQPATPGSKNHFT